ncbi:MAG: preprotein translocase subunit SecE [Synergistaceae bacterium]|jgi:preprotein translocase subunit SecE|nr:preprotein translocase subunit SecE [Synergistaceae bacterium]
MNKFLDYIKRVTRFLRESKAEMKKVFWPTKKDVGYSTLVVIGLTLVVGLYVGLVDAALQKLLSLFIGTAP